MYEFQQLAKGNGSTQAALRLVQVGAAGSPNSFELYKVPASVMKELLLEGSLVYISLYYIYF